MAYIGRTPTGSILTSADIADGSISTAKLEDNAVTTAKITDNAVTAAKYVEYPAYRNLIINGDMSIAQRGTSVSGKTADGYYTTDRWNHSINLGTWSIDQSTDVPTGQGFAKSHKMTCTTGGSTSAGTQTYLHTRLEGQMLQHIKKGTSNAESLTLSFWGKSATTTGTMTVELFDTDNSRQISKQISLTTSWTKYTITYDADTTGTLTNDNGASLYVLFWVSAGSNFNSGTLSETWTSNTNANRAVGQTNFAVTNTELYITGVQLEVGTSASDFEFLPYDVNLQRCQRYYETSYDAVPAGTASSSGSRRFNGSTDAGSNMVWGEKYAVTKRAAPTQTFYRDDQTNTTGWAFASSGPSGTASANNWNFTIHQISAYFTFGSAHNWANGYVQGHWVADAEL